MPVRFAHEAATFNERLLELGESGRLVDLSKLSVDVETLLDQLHFTDRGGFLGDPLLDLGTPLLESATRLRAGTFGALRAG